MNKKPIISLVRSGGQTGTDRAALVVGRKMKYPICGWCPKGGWAEDMTSAPGLRRLFPEMMETPSEKIAQRTEWNVRDSHVTVVLGDPDRSFGTRVTGEFAAAYERPFIVVGEKETPEEVMVWLAEAVGRGLTVNFAGPRESESPGVQAYAEKFIAKMLEFNAKELGSDNLLRQVSEKLSAKPVVENAKPNSNDPFAGLVMEPGYEQASSKEEPENEIEDRQLNNLLNAYAKHAEEERSDTLKEASSPQVDPFAIAEKESQPEDEIQEQPEAEVQEADVQEPEDEGQKAVFDKSDEPDETPSPEPQKTNFGNYSSEIGYEDPFADFNDPF